MAHIDHMTLNGNMQNIKSLELLFYKNKKYFIILIFMQ